MKSKKSKIGIGARMNLKMILIVAVAACSSVAFAQTQPANPSAQPSYDALEELAGRLIGYGFEEPELVVGRLPGERLKLELAIPAGARVLGTSIRGESFEIVMDVKDQTEKVLNFYRKAFEGWEDKGAQQGGPRGGFTFGGEGEFRPYVADTLLCKDEWSVNVIVYRLDAAIKDVRLRINKYDCGFVGSPVELPKLLAPKGSESLGGSSGFGGDIFSSITLNTTLNAGQLFEHYASQLEKANWKPLDKIALKVGMLGTYEFVSKDGQKWGAVLSILPAKGNLLNAALRVYPL
jgi:hypothetical protein